MSGYVGAILASGRGRRMGPLGEHYPKPLLPVGDAPLIVHHLRTLYSLGIHEVYIVVGHLADTLRRVLGDGARYDMHLTYVEQSTPLGSAHALGQLAPYIDRPLVLLLGDYFFAAPDLSRMLARAQAEGVAVMAAKREPDRVALCEACVLLVDDAQRIQGIVEKPKAPATDLKGCGIYIFPPVIFDAVRRTPRSMLRDEYELTVAIELYIQAGQPVYADEVITWDTNFTRPQDVLECNLTWLAQHGQQAWVGANVALAPGTRLERAIVGDDGVVAAPVVLREVVVFPGGQVNQSGQIERALITPDLLIPCGDAAVAPSPG